jgi:hypothetical protein
MNAPRFLLTVALAVLLAALAPAAFAFDMNGFLPEPGHGDLALSYTSEGYEEFWVGETKVSDPGVGEVDISSVSAWFQWGLSDDLAIVGNLAHVDASGDGLGGFADSGLQDLAVLLKFRCFASGPHSLVSAGGFRTPASDYEANLPVDLGDGTDDVLLRLVYLYQGPGGFYFSQQVGYDIRGDDAPDGFPLYTELGLTSGRITYSAWLSYLTADGGTDIGDPGFTFPSNKEEYTRFGAKVYGRVTDGFGLSAAYFDTTDGRNTGDTDGFSVGGVLKF